MFTGIVECTGRVIAARSTPTGLRLSVRPEFDTSEVKDGDSIAVNGVCLTVAAKSAATLDFDVVSETLGKTNLGTLHPNDAVNLERSLRIGDRIEGHWVQGHITATARLTRKIASTAEWRLWFSLSDEIRPYVVPKGSVAIDGVSLTVADLTSDEFSVALIPTTLERTILGQRNVGDPVNVETDLIVRTVVHNIGSISSDQKLFEKLKASGFMDNY